MEWPAHLPIIGGACVSKTLKKPYVVMVFHKTNPTHGEDLTKTLWVSRFEVGNLSTWRLPLTSP